MSKKNLQSLSGLVYSTDPDFKPDTAETPVTATLPPEQQKLRIKLETKHRAGKSVTVIEGFIGTDDDRETLGKVLKAFCGTGGSAKDGEIIVQGDNRDKILKWLQGKGYKLAKRV